MAVVLLPDGADAEYVFPLPPGEISGVFVQAGDEPPFVMPRVQFVPERGCVELRLNDASPTALRSDHPFVPVSTSTALVAQLDLKYDPIYQRALQRAAEIVTAAHADEK